MDGMYRKLLLALSINAVLMFLITFANVAQIGHVHANLNRVYMALMMVAPMGIVMLLVMGAMFEDRTRNLVLYGSFAVLLALTYAFTRGQTLVGNEQFLRSMIPHHSSAILMCEKSSITDPEIARLCDQIVESQREEIAQMEAILGRY